ncbi:hypothetical protein FOZ62_023576 [Perkinsus olseni]|uniref:Prolyl 4-hydroxylase alpha subunit Fe(2+) 2OG dioxygenase domain-containing protein n=2 Tax=Perkinsus olseni TaxID=32597 RepID=A0A7J6T086_PEROL|nr:hypothetical protein FOZ62_023576 [Perkinsus olseni]
MRFLLLHLLASLCGAGESSDFNSASAGLKAMAAWADSDEELTVGEVAITLYTMRHISRSLLSKGEEATPLFWAWLRDFEDQAESIINAKDELFTLNVLTHQFRDDIKIFLDDFGESTLGPFLDDASSDQPWTDDSQALPCYVDSPQVDIADCSAGVIFARADDFVTLRDQLRGRADIGVVVKAKKELEKVQSSGVSPKWVLASSKRLVEDAKRIFEGALVSQGKVAIGVAAASHGAGFVLASRGDIGLYGYNRLRECGQEKGYTILRDPQNKPLTTAKLNSVNCDIPTVDPEAMKGPSDIYPDYYTRAQLKLASGRLSGIAPEHTSPEALERLHEDLLKNDYAVYTPDAYTAETFQEILSEAERLWRVGENRTSGMEANCNLDGTHRMGGYVGYKSELYRLIFRSNFRLWASLVTKAGALWGADFPMELREYGRRSGGMPCHSDLQMYKTMELDWEVVVTVSNSPESKCEFTWTAKNGEKRSVRTTANSVTLVRPNSAVHCVTSTAGGRREMLKMILTGDYSKDKGFWYYTGNQCGKKNNNRRLMRERSEEMTKAYSSGGEAEEL